MRDKNNNVINQYAYNFSPTSTFFAIETMEERSGLESKNKKLYLIEQKIDVVFCFINIILTAKQTIIDCL